MNRERETDRERLHDGFEHLLSLKKKKACLNSISISNNETQHGGRPNGDIRPIGAKYTLQFEGSGSRGTRTRNVMCHI